MIALQVQKPGFANRTRCVQGPNWQSGLETAKDGQCIAALTPKKIEITQHVNISVVCVPKTKRNKGQVKQLNLVNLYIYIYRYINTLTQNIII